MKLISACDVIYFNLLTFQQYPDMELHIIRDAEYIHNIHNGSTYLNDINGNTEQFRENIIIPAYYKLNNN